MRYRRRRKWLWSKRKRSYLSKARRLSTKSPPDRSGPHPMPLRPAKPRPILQHCGSRSKQRGSSFWEMGRLRRSGALRRVRGDRAQGVSPADPRADGRGGGRWTRASYGQAATKPFQEASLWRSPGAPGLRTSPDRVSGHGFGLNRPRSAGSAIGRRACRPCRPRRGKSRRSTSRAATMRPPDRRRCSA